MSDHASTAVWTGDAEFRSGDGASPEVFSEVKNIQTVRNVHSGTALEKPVTPLGATRVQRKRTIKDSDAMEVVLHFNPDDPVHVRLYTAWEAGTTDNYQILRPSGETISGGCYINMWREGEYTPEGFQEVTVGFREDPPWPWGDLYV